MLSGQRRTDADRILIQHGKWHVVELELTLEKMKWLWDEMRKYRSLFSDLTRGSAENFYAVMSMKDSFWLEVLDDQEQTIGLVYWTGLSQLIDCDVHMMFFDRKPSEKLGLCKEIAKWFFVNFPQYNRMTATLPITYYATIRLARKVGFAWEGKKRESQLMNKQKLDEVILGLLASEIL